MKRIKKLTRREFARAMKLGHGRALLHVKKYGDEGIEEEMKNSLLINRAYDVQIEGLRSGWLWQILMLTGRPQFYGEHLLNNIDQPPGNYLDFAQRFELASSFFEIGMTEFRPTMFTCFAKMANEPRMSSRGRALVEVSGLAGLEFVARTCGAVPDSLDDYEGAQVLKRAIEWSSERDVMEHMNELGENEGSVRAFMDICEKFKSVWEGLPKSAAAVRPTLDDLLAMVQRGEARRFSGKFRVFGKHATEDELVRVLELLKHTSDERHQLAFLHVFNWRAMPEISTEVIDLLQAKNRQIRWSAAKALSRTRSERVRQAALALLQSDKSSSVSLGLDLLEHNYVTQDSDIILRVLKRLGTPTDIHSAGMAVRNICSKSAGAELEAAVLWLYENGPDSFCRSAFLEQLVDWKKCPIDILYEAQWDSGSEVQEFARRKMAEYETEDKNYDSVL